MEALTVQGAAASAMDQGWQVFPVYGPDLSRPTRCSCGNPECGHPAKHPATRHGVKDASRDFDLIPHWWPKRTTRGIALATGKASGVWVLDLDGPTGLDSFLDLEREHGKIPPTVTSRTGGGGFHLVFSMPEGRDVSSSTSVVAEKIDVRGSGGYAIIPPSGHASGLRYEWAIGRGPDVLFPTPAPDWLVELATKRKEPSTFPPPPLERPRGNRYVEAAIAAEVARLASAPNGTRNETLNRAAFALARFVAEGLVSPEIVIQALAPAAARKGLRHGEIKKTLLSAFGARGLP